MLSAFKFIFLPAFWFSIDSVVLSPSLCVVNWLLLLLLFIIIIIIIIISFFA